MHSFFNLLGDYLFPSDAIDCNSEAKTDAQATLFLNSVAKMQNKA